MTLKSVIKDGRGSNNLAGVSIAGELLVKGIGANQANNQAMTVNGQAYNFFPPLVGNTFIITTMIISVKAATTIDIFAAPNATSNVANVDLFTTTITNAATLVIPLPFGGFLPVGEGEFLNGTTTNATSQVTIIGYYSPT